MPSASGAAGRLARSRGQPRAQRRQPLGRQHQQVLCHGRLENRLQDVLRDLEGAGLQVLARHVSEVLSDRITDPHAGTTTVESDSRGDRVIGCATLAMLICASSRARWDGSSVSASASSSMGCGMQSVSSREGLATARVRPRGGSIQALTLQWRWWVVRDPLSRGRVGPFLRHLDEDDGAVAAALLGAFTGSFGYDPKIGADGSELRFGRHRHADGGHDAAPGRRISSDQAKALGRRAVPKAAHELVPGRVEGKSSPQPVVTGSRSVPGRRARRSVGHLPGQQGRTGVLQRMAGGGQ